MQNLANCIACTTIDPWMSSTEGECTKQEQACYLLQATAFTTTTFPNKPYTRIAVGTTDSNANTHMFLYQG